MAVAFIGDRRVAAGNQKGELFVWDLPEAPEAAPAAPDKKGGEKQRTAPSLPPARRLVGHDNGITRLVALPDGRHLVSASLDRSVKLWDLDSPSTGTAEAVLDIDFRKSEVKRTRKNDALEQPGVKVETLAAIHTFAGHEDWVQSLACSGDGRLLISGDNASRVIVWSVPERKELARWSGRPWNWIIAAALNADGTKAFVSEHRYKRDDFDVPSAALKVWSTSDKKELLDLMRVQFPKYNSEDASYGGSQVWRKFVGAGLIAVAFSPDGKRLAAGQGGETDKGEVHLFDAETGKLVRTLGNHQYGITDLMFSPDSKFLITAGRDTSVRVWNVEDGKEALVLGAPRGGQFKDWISAVALSPDQTRIAAADIGGTVAIWRVEAAS